eukprot:gnl/MRDRNA2_/MRDRNA2_120576_c0_seq1.p1 gnl/MRDRNA2_/MRDRNA2_120576_c0~~gnl/MRDRNA2_/MRDRNA2_120576_c0_seq1.p1  ORF type:complete len:497 (+),score=56.77 gnl/MRDRNA2_/MRDRNA2_120576_c0_seq1:31-1491(+)
MFSAGYLSCDATTSPVAYLADYNSVNRATNCASISQNNAYLNLQYPSCAFRYCPNCFNFLAFTEELRATFTNCQWYLGVNQDDDAVQTYYFANSGNFSVEISDGTTIYTLAPGSIPDDTTAPQYHAHQAATGASAMWCVCYNSKLQCTAPTVNDDRRSLYGLDETGVAGFPKKLSVTDAVHLGSALSIRSFARFGSSLSVLDFAHIGSSLSVRSFARFGSSFKVQGRTTIQDDTNAYYEYDSGNLNFYVQNVRTLSMTKTGGGGAAGTLHGAWSTDSATVVSDSRRKTDIRPIDQALREIRDGPNTDGSKKARSPRVPRVFGFGGGAKHSPGWESEGTKQSKSQQGDDKDDSSGTTSNTSPDRTSEDPASWILRELRPVSYKIKDSKESARHYGFVAEDLQKVLPDVVRIGSDKERTKSVAYQDFIALIVAAFQAQQRGAQLLETGSEARFSTLEERFARLEDRFTKMENSIEQLAARYGACCPVV